MVMARHVKTNMAMRSPIVRVIVIVKRRLPERVWSIR